MQRMDPGVDGLPLCAARASCTASTLPAGPIDPHEAVRKAEARIARHLHPQAIAATGRGRSFDPGNPRTRQSRAGRCHGLRRTESPVVRRWPWRCRARAACDPPASPAPSTASLSSGRASMIPVPVSSSRNSDPASPASLCQSRNTRNCARRA